MKHTMQIPNMHKAMIATVLCGLFSLGASAAFAQKTSQTADMTVTGTIVPAACSANFEGGSVVDFGTIRLIDLPASAYHPLGTRSTALSVTCTSNKRVDFSVLDLQSSTVIDDAAMLTLLGGVAATHVFGLGAATVSGSAVNLGSYQVVSPNRTVDGVPRNVILSTNDGSTWGAQNPGRLYNIASHRYTAGSSVSTPALGQQFRFSLDVTAALNHGSRLQVAQDTPLNGQLVFAINYQ